MNAAATASNSKSDSDHFPSLASLRTAHSELLKLHREQGNNPETWVEIEQLIHKGRATGALLDSDDDRWAAQSLLDYWSSLLYRSKHEPPDATLAEYDPSLASTLDDSLCPYLGLEAFREGNQNLFFGRQLLVDKLVEHLTNNRLLALVGSSGSGKSSVVMGGLLPRLKTGAIPDSQEWHYYSPIIPGADPLAALLLQLASSPLQDNSQRFEQEIAKFLHNSDRLLEIINSKSQPIVLVIDQFEEVFTLCRDPQIRQAFIDNLLKLVEMPSMGHKLILTIRSDFESQVARIPDLFKLFEKSSVRITPLDAAEMREAIEKPAELRGLKFEEGLIDALLNDVLGEPAALPLLPFTLLKLWDNREYNRLTWDAYRKLGGGRVALSRSADQFYEQLIPEEQVTTKRILLRMVRPTEGLEVTSNRILRKEIYQAGEAPDRVDRVLDKLIQARLIRQTPGNKLDNAQIEVSHEALIRNWSHLVDWLDSERINLRQRLVLTENAKQWLLAKRDPDLLLRGARLQEALSCTDLPDLEQEFVQCSYRAERKRNRLRTGMLALVFSSPIFLLFVGLLAWTNQKVNDTNQKLTVQKQELITQTERLNKALNLLQSLDETSLIGSFSTKTGLASAIKDTGDSLSAFEIVLLPVENSLRSSLKTFLPELNSTLFAEFTADNKYVTTTNKRPATDRKRTATVWILPTLNNGAIEQSLTPFFEFEMTSTKDKKGEDINSNIVATAVSKDSQYIFTANKMGNWQLWNRQNNRKPISELKDEEGNLINSDFITSASISSDNKLIIGGSRDGTVNVWQWKENKLLEFFEQPKETANEREAQNEYVTSVAISQNNKIVAGGFSNGKIRLWLTDGKFGQKLCSSFSHPDNYVTAVNFLDSNTVVASGTSGRSFKWKFGIPIVCNQTPPQSQMIPDFLERNHWQNLLNLACNNIKIMRYLENPVESATRGAKKTCAQYIWKTTVPNNK